MTSSPPATPIDNIDLRAFFVGFIKQVFFWTPIVVGIIFQILMRFFGFTRIYVILNPPEYIYPFVTLEPSWWLLMLLLSILVYFLASTGRLRPHRLVVPLYLYIVYLLIFVKPA
jgi:hypothetical protein